MSCCGCDAVFRQVCVQAPPAGPCTCRCHPAKERRQTCKHASITDGVCSFCGERRKYSTADISPCGRYRYCLRRRWSGDLDNGRIATFIMLNPSTADVDTDDPTIRRCIGFAKRWGMDGISVVNLFALRSPKPGALAVDHDPVGPDNDAWISRVTREAGGSLIVAWGAHGEPYLARVREVVKLLPAARCLAVLKSGHPAHPLMLPYRLMPQPWSLAEVGG